MATVKEMANINVQHGVEAGERIANDGTPCVWTTKQKKICANYRLHGDLLLEGEGRAFPF